VGGRGGKIQGLGSKIDGLNIPRINRPVIEEVLVRTDWKTKRERNQRESNQLNATVEVEFALHKVRPTQFTGLRRVIH